VAELTSGVCMLLFTSMDKGWRHNVLLHASQLPLPRLCSTSGVEPDSCTACTSTFLYLSYKRRLMIYARVYAILRSKVKITNATKPCIKCASAQRRTVRSHDVQTWRKYSHPDYKTTNFQLQNTMMLIIG